MITKSVKEKLVGAAGTASGTASILGSWQICHNLCLGIIALLAIMGITLTGMPLLFFTKIAIPLWIIAIILLVIVIYFYIKKHCISKGLILFNLGLIIAGTPLKSVQSFQIVFWIIGGITTISGISFSIKDKLAKKNMRRCKHA